MQAPVFQERAHKPRSGVNPIPGLSCVPSYAPGLSCVPGYALMPGTAPEMIGKASIALLHTIDRTPGFVYFCTVSADRYIYAC
jgi:hypothetical protein